MKVLVVEDNEMNRDMLQRRLERAGIEVVVATHGAEALELAHACLPDAVLMDLSLPVLDGWEATRRLKAHPDTAHIPVIALTAHALREDRHRAREAGCDAYHAKPIDFQALLATLRELTPS